MTDEPNEGCDPLSTVRPFAGLSRKGGLPYPDPIPTLASQNRACIVPRSAILMPKKSHFASYYGHLEDDVGIPLHRNQLCDALGNSFNGGEGACKEPNAAVADFALMGSTP